MCLVALELWTLYSPMHELKCFSCKTLLIFLHKESHDLPSLIKRKRKRWSQRLWSAWRWTGFNCNNFLKFPYKLKAPLLFSSLDHCWACSHYCRQFSESFVFHIHNSDVLVILSSHPSNGNCPFIFPESFCFNLFITWYCYDYLIRVQS